MDQLIMLANCSENASATRLPRDVMLQHRQDSYDWAWVSQEDPRQPTAFLIGDTIDHEAAEPVDGIAQSLTNLDRPEEDDSTLGDAAEDCPIISMNETLLKLFTPYMCVEGNAHEDGPKSECSLELKATSGSHHHVPVDHHTDTHHHSVDHHTDIPSPPIDAHSTALLSDDINEDGSMSECSLEPIFKVGMVKCSTHGKSRTMRNCSDDGMGGYTCNKGTECQMKPEKKTATAAAKPLVELCHFYQKGFCKRGGTCWYAHSKCTRPLITAHPVGSSW